MDIIIKSFLVLLAVAIVYCHSHSHDEPAHFKYSESANTHDEDDHHGHSHDHHGHAHDAHDIDDHHGHDHGHGHAHGGEQGHGHSHGKGGCSGHGHSHGGGKQREAKNKQDFVDYTQVEDEKLHEGSGTIWMKALLSTLLISAAPILILFFIHIDNSPKYEKFLKVLLSFASGGLLGDAFLHLIPHAIEPHDHGDASHSHAHAHSHGGEGHSHDHSKTITVGIWVLAGVLVFLVIEKLARIARGDEEGHGHSHAIPAPEKKPVQKPDEKKKEKSKKKSDEEDEKEEKEEDSTEAVVVSGGDMKIAGYLNLVADFTHNFTDGLAIGASFLAGDSVGIVTTITIFFHEIPHEIGDYAILVQSGCSRGKAMLLQLTTAFGALLGTVVSLACGGVSGEKTLWILPFTAGGFIYIATVSVIPELLKNSTMKQSIKEIIALLLGVFLMVIVAFYE